MMLFPFRGGRRGLRRRVLAFGSSAASATVLLLFLSVVDPPGPWGLALLVAEGLANGAALLFFTVLWGARYTMNGARAGGSMAVSFALAYIFNVIPGLIPHGVAAVLLTLLMPLSCAVWLFDEGKRSVGDPEEDSARSELTEGDAKLGILPWRVLSVFALIALVSVLFQGFSDPGF